MHTSLSEILRNCIFDRDPQRLEEILADHFAIDIAIALRRWATMICNHCY